VVVDVLVNVIAWQPLSTDSSDAPAMFSIMCAKCSADCTRCAKDND